MTGRDRLRRVVLLCAHFIRNMAYYRAGHDRLAKKRVEFWITVDGNFIDMAVIAWCSSFATETVNTSGLRWSRNQFHSKIRCFVTSACRVYVNELCIYRDKFLAHLDDLTTMEIPFLDRARAAVEFYHRHVVEHEAVSGDLAGLPSDLAAYYKECYEQATGAVFSDGHGVLS